VGASRRSNSIVAGTNRMASQLPQGFILHADFLDQDEESRLITYIQTIPFGSVQMRGVTAKRRVAQFGWRYSFETYKLTTAAPLPPRSMYLLTGEARNQWQHTIPAVHELRWSITFRTVRSRLAAKSSEKRTTPR